MGYGPKYSVTLQSHPRFQSELLLVVFDTVRVQTASHWRINMMTDGITVTSTAEPGQRTAIRATPCKGAPISSPFSCRLCSHAWQEVSSSDPSRLRCQNAPLSHRPPTLRPQIAGGNPQLRARTQLSSFNILSFRNFDTTDSNSGECICSPRLSTGSATPALPPLP